MRAGEEIDASRFEAIVRQHDERLRALAYRMLGDRTAMDDALQEAYLKAWRGLGDFRGEAAIGSWLYRIVTTTCLDHLRRRARRQGHEVLDDDSEASALPGSGPGGAGVGERLELNEALARLAPGHRAVVLLVDVHGFGYHEVGAMLGIAPGTVGSRLNRAHQALRHLLAPDAATTDEKGGDR
ncbi:MAG: RNA polymerase sigma factor [Acidimicrobiales bacterium]